jgi:anti-anti-sigma factor
VVEPGGVFQAETNHLDGLVVVALSGDLDLAARPVLRSVLNSHLDDDRDLVLDLARVTFMDSSGLEMLLAAHAELRPGRRIVLRHVQERVHRVLDLTGTLELFSLES